MSQPVREWCDSCLRWLAHDPRYCPLFPEVPKVKKWGSCVCLVHTCFDAKALGIKRDKSTDATYRDF